VVVAEVLNLLVVEPEMLEDQEVVLLIQLLLEMWDQEILLLKQTNKVTLVV
tara:strand:- start:269 stop:421 length:153 start_codon:yes stop_codon:yes gene_type:complete